MKVEIFDKQNKKSGEIALSDKVFDVELNKNLIHQAITTHMANSRKPWAHVKDRGEVSGGGKKPWKQKGTGRARHGSIRSPLWIGGGVTHGPRNERDFSKKLNKKMKQLATFMALSQKLRDKELIIVDELGNSKKTKDWTNILKNFIDLRTKTALILEAANKNSAKAISNIKNIDTLCPKSLNAYDLFRSKYIILESKAVEEIQNHYKNISNS